MVMSFVPTRPRTTAFLGKASVVIIASAASCRPSGERAATSAPAWARTFSTGRGTPMTPVDETSRELLPEEAAFSTASTMALAFR